MNVKDTVCCKDVQRKIICKKLRVCWHISGDVLCILRTKPTNASVNTPIQDKLDSMCSEWVTKILDGLIK